MATGIENYPNIIPAGTGYPKGSIKDDTGPNDGTPVNKLVYDDIHQTFMRLLQLAGLTANGQPDNATNGYQYVEAILRLSKRSNGTIYTPTGINLTPAQVRNLVVAETAVSAILHSLPDSSLLQDGDSFMFYNNGNYEVTIQSNGSDSVMGGADITLNLNGDYVELILDKSGQRWGIANYKYTATPPVVVPVPKPVYAYKVAGTQTGTVNTIIPSGEAYDADNLMSMVNGKYIAPKAGYYKVTLRGHIYISAAVSLDVTYLLYKNGVNVGNICDIDQGYSGSSANLKFNGSTIVECVPTDELTFVIGLSGSETIHTSEVNMYVEYMPQ